MAKKKSSGFGGILVIAIVFALGAAYEWCRENVELVAAFLAMLSSGFVIRAIWRKKRRRDWIRYLRGKYNDEQIVTSILGAEFWTGQTEDQLRDSLGRPHGVDTQRLKTKTKEVWKYGEQRKGQFALRITLENGQVVGWDQRS